jgi:osmotically-inducible protein OsmY
MDFLTRSALRLSPLFTAGDGMAILLLLLALLWFSALAAAPGEVIPPEELSRAVERELRADPVLQDADLYAISRHGEVTLGGTVERLLWQRRAERAAETVRGVRTVVNRIAIMSPELVPDSELEQRIHRVLTTMPDQGVSDVAVSVEHGRVRLEGKATSAMAREHADDLVAGMIGVREVQNRLVLAPERRLSGAALAEAVQHAIDFDALLSGGRIEATADGTKVRLVGEVHSAAERRRARLRAARAGATDVDISRLAITERHQQPGRAPLQHPDQAIERAVREAFATEPRLHAHELAVRVHAGEVKLAGTVSTLHEKRLAARVASHVRGVRRVHQLITTRAPTGNARELTARTTAALRNDPLIGDQKITVAVQKDVAILSGPSTTAWQRQYAETVVAAVPGIREVHNRIVGPAPIAETHDKPYVGAPFVKVNTTADKPSPAQDEATAEAIRDQLQWSAFVESARINVYVNQGIATLTGHVPTRFQAAMATQEAYEGGARLVKNLLAVE